MKRARHQFAPFMAGQEIIKPCCCLSRARSPLHRRILIRRCCASLFFYRPPQYLSRRYGYAGGLHQSVYRSNKADFQTLFFSYTHQQYLRVCQYLIFQSNQNSKTGVAYLFWYGYSFQPDPLTEKACHKKLRCHSFWHTRLTLSVQPFRIS